MKQSTKRIFAATMAALVVAAAGTTLTTQLPQLTNNVVHAEDGATQTIPVVTVDVSKEEGDAAGNYKFADGMFKLLKREVNYVLTGTTDKKICFFGTSEQNKTETYYATLDNLSSTNSITFQNSGAKLVVNVPEGTTNTLKNLNTVDLTIQGKGTLNAEGINITQQGTNTRPSALNITDTTINVKVTGNSNQWHGTCLLSGSANVTFTNAKGNDYTPLSLGGAGTSNSLTLKDNARLSCLLEDETESSSSTVDGFSVFGDTKITLKDDSYLEAHGKKTSGEYPGYGIIVWANVEGGEKPMTIQVEDRATIKATAQGPAISTNNFIMTGGKINAKSYGGEGIYADTIEISAAEVEADGHYPGLFGSNTGNGITIDKSMVKATSSGSNGIYAPTVKISAAEVEADGYYSGLFGGDGGLTIQNSTVSATASNNSGLWSHGDLKIENSIVSAVTKDPEHYWGASTTGTASVTNSWIETAGGVTDNIKPTHSVLFDGADGSVIGDATLPDSVTVAKGLTLTIPKDTTLTIPTDKTLTNEGAIVNRGKVIVNGTVTNNGTIDCTSHFSQSGTVCDLCKASTVVPTPSAPSSITTTETTVDPDTGTVTETVTTTHPDGSKTITKTETQTDGTKTVTKTETKPDGSKTETSTKTDKDGNVIEKMESKVEVKDDKSTVETTTTTKPGENTKTETVVEKDASGNITRETTTTSSTNAEDLSKVIVEKEIYKNSRGTEVEKTTTTVINSSGATESVTVEHDIPNIGNKTDASIRTEKDGNGIVTIDKVGTMKEKGMQATFTNKVVSQLKEAAGENLLLHMTVKDKDGNKRYSVEVNSADLTPKNKLYIYKKDSKTGALYMVNSKAYTTDSKGQLKLMIRSKGDFVLKNAEEAAKINKEILATVQVKNNKVTLEKGKTTTFAFSEELDMRNVKKITYTSSKTSVATVNENGKIKGKKAGTTTITATVTLKNGDTKIVTMKVTVK